MPVVAHGQDLRRYCWTPVDPGGWRTPTETVPIHPSHIVPQEFLTEPVVFDWGGGFEADDDIRAGRVRTFDSVQALIDDLHGDD